MSVETIAVDVDDVLTNTAAAIVAFSNSTWGTSLALDDYDDHWAKMWHVDTEEALRRRAVMEGANLHAGMPGDPQAKEVLDRLSQKYRLVVVTSRWLAVKDQTINWINEHYSGVFDEIHFTGIWDAKHGGDVAGNMTKTEILRQLGANMLIDDQLKHCLAAADAGISALLFGDYGWNRNVKLPNTVTRVKDWQAVEGYLSEPSRS